MKKDFFKVLSDSIGEREVIIYGAGSMGTLLLNIIDALGKEVLYFLDQNIQKQQNGFYGYEVKSPADILYEDMSNKIVILSSAEKSEELEGVLIGFGLKKDVEFIQGGALAFAPCNIIDPFLGYSRLADVNGFKIMGDYDKKNKNIICLGGSTTDDSLLGIKSWPQYLYEMLENDHVLMNVFNGGITGYNSSQELLKLIRDGLELGPSLVISYSGINDFTGQSPALESKYLSNIWEKTIQNSAAADSLSLSHGAKTQLDAAEYWYRNEVIMCNICRGFDIPFLGILQPSIFTKETEMYSLYEKRALQMKSSKEEIIKRYSKAKELVNEGVERYIVDFTALFDLCDDVYADYAHVFERGNKVIAGAIYKTIREKKLL